MSQTQACRRTARCPDRGGNRCAACATETATETTTAPRVTLAEDAVMAMAITVSFATIFIALALLLA